MENNFEPIKNNFEPIKDEEVKGNKDNFAFGTVYSPINGSVNFQPRDKDSTFVAGNANAVRPMRVNNFNIKPEIKEKQDYKNERAKENMHRLPLVFSLLGVIMSIFLIGLPFAFVGLLTSYTSQNKQEDKDDMMIKYARYLGYTGIGIGVATIAIFIICMFL